MPAGGPQRRRKRETQSAADAAFRGGGCPAPGPTFPLLTPPPPVPAPPERSWQCLHGSAYPPELLAVSWQRVRCEAGPAHRAGEPARPTCKRAIRIDAAQPLATPAPYQRRRGGLPGCRVAGPAGIFHFLNDSVAGQGNHWSSRLSPGGARWVILMLDVYL